MTWYYCANHPKPLLFTCPFVRPCPNCGQPFVPAHDVLRYEKPNDYKIYWHEQPDGVVLRLELGRYKVLLTDDVLPYDTVNFSPNLQLSPPGKGNWFGNIAQYSGGFRHQTDSGNAPSLSNMKVLLGQNDGGNAYGLTHILKGHASMFNNLSSSPSTSPFGLESFRDNLRNITAPKSPATGIRWVAKQISNGRYVIHGVTKGQHGMLILDSTKLITAYSGTNMGGLGQQPSRIREWS